jgi:integrase
MLKEDNVRKGFFERTHFEGVRSRLKPPLAQVVTLAYYTGWRVPSEILTLEWHQVDRQACIIRLEPGTTKNREGRMFTYGELTEVREAIDVLWARHEALEKEGLIRPRLFVRGGGQPVLSCRKRFNEACRAAGCPGRLLHDFRCTAVRNLSRAGVPETVAMKITGHKTRSVFDRYDITSEEDLSEATRKLQTLTAATGTITGTIGDYRPTGQLIRVRKSRGVSRLAGDRGGDRTRDPRIKSAMLYH